MEIDGVGSAERIAHRVLLNPPERLDSGELALIMANYDLMRTDLARINEDLRRHGIEYPLGANGVHDLTNFAIEHRQTVLDVARALGLPESTASEPILEEISRLLAIEDGAQ